MTHKESVQEAAEQVRLDLYAQKLYAVVNNAGIYKGPTPQEVINTNLYGPKYVSEAFVPLIQDHGRIVNMSADMAALFVSKLNNDQKQMLTSSDITWE